ncbi:lysine exporter LysO family protein [Alkalibacterium kapii]|uniref:Uncharacterized protein n=1 Tax=Alkalibacterium kapii TaxID=426704 RepID=A0A511ARA4_9LACT|nr:lysine exporter LysO family protein [Alkalibacterium kapii]GEK90744.1 hypothetical protein AKA01nite_03660 [Alkalibacterium kapii]
MSNIPINLLFSLLIVVGVIALVIFVQIRLSRSKNKYLGLILPAFFFISSLLAVLGWYSFSGGTTTEIGSSVNIDEQSGEVINESEDVIISVENQEMDATDYLSLGYVFLVNNIPTVILVGIYRSERNKMSLKKEIERMKIDDL